MREFYEEDFDSNADERGQCEILEKRNCKIGTPSYILRVILLSLDNENGNKTGNQEEQIEKADNELLDI